MAVLEADTLYYRDDHPRGYLLAEGEVAPNPDDGWVATPEEVIARDPSTFECTSLEAYEQLLKSERASNALLQEQVRVAQAEVGGLQAHISLLRVQLQLAGAQAPHEDA